MKLISLSTIIFLLSLLSAGCSQKQTIDGEVFIDTRSGASKLSLVKIQVVPEEQFIAHIKTQLPKAKTLGANLSSYISEAEKSNSESQALIAQSVMGRAFSPPSMSSLENANAANRLQESMNRSAARVAESRVAVNGIATGANPLYFAGDFEGVIGSTETNSDGKFSLSFESGKRVVLIAVKDGFTWALWLTPDKSKSTIALTNKNLSGSGCSNCVFGGTVTPASITGG